MSTRRRLVAGNWKMNGSRAANEAWLARYRGDTVDGDANVQVVICPPFAYLADLGVGLAASGVELGAQDVSADRAGAFTGDVAAEMLKDVGCAWVIVGHSERRAGHSESDAVVAAKTERVLAAGLRPIVCVGETLAQRESGSTADVVVSQLDAVLNAIGADALGTGALAYEPVWAIGTGRTASAGEAQEIHALLRAQVKRASVPAADALRIVYGGSVKPSNAAELFAQADIDGGLIGGASLIAEDFRAICRAR